MRLDIEAIVVTRDRKHSGKVGRVVVDPRTNEVVDLIVRRSKGLFDVRDIVVPMALVARSEAGRVALSVSAAELEKLPDFVQTDYIPVPPEWFLPTAYPPGGLLWPAGLAAVALTEEERENVPEGTVTLSEGTDVYCPDGHIGVVDEVVSDPHRQQVLGFIVRRGVLVTHDLFIPIGWVAEIQADRLILNRTKAEVEHLAERAAE